MFRVGIANNGAAGPALYAVLILTSCPLAPRTPSTLNGSGFVFACATDGGEWDGEDAKIDLPRRRPMELFLRWRRRWRKKKKKRRAKMRRTAMEAPMAALAPRGRPDDFWGGLREDNEESESVDEDDGDGEESVAVPDEDRSEEFAGVD